MGLFRYRQCPPRAVAQRFWVQLTWRSWCLPAPGEAGLWLLLLSWMASEPGGDAEPPRTPWGQSHVCWVSSQGLEAGFRIPADVEELLEQMDTHGVPFTGTCQPFQPPCPPKSRSGSELFILCSGWNALTAKLLYKISNGDEKSTFSLSIPFFCFPASRETFQAVSFAQWFPVSCKSWALSLAELWNPSSLLQLNYSHSAGFPQIKHSTLHIIHLGLLLV